MKAVLISIQPKWCELIANGKKTVEVRKTKPKLETPFKCYIYQTRKTWVYDIYSRIADWQGKVIGEFVCDRIRCEKEVADGLVDIVFEITSCINARDLFEYANGNVLYSWHISDLVIYDKPKELREFTTFCNSYFDGDKCDGCKYFINGDCYEYDESDCGCNGLKPITKPPQSWCYVERLGEG